MMATRVPMRMANPFQRRRNINGRARIAMPTNASTIFCACMYTLLPSAVAFVAPPTSVAGIFPALRPPRIHGGSDPSASPTELCLAVGVPNLEDLIYSAQSEASSLAAASTASSGGSGATPTSLAVLYLAGLLTSFSPCSLGLLPLTVSYISAAAGERDDKAALLPTIAFAGGLAAVFCGLGLSASLLGGVFGSSSQDSLLGTIILAFLSSGVSVAMGLQILDLVDIPLPSFDLKVPFASADGTTDGASSSLLFDDDGNMIVPTAEERPQRNDGGGNDGMALARTFLLGGSSALVASPCATPVLTSILAYVAASRDPTLGAALLATYTIGYSTPLLIVGATGGEALAKAQAQAEDGSIAGTIGRFVTPLTGAVLIWYGTTGFLNTLFGDPSLVGLAPVLD